MNSPPPEPLYVINKMLVRFDAKLTEELRQQIADSGRTIHEVLTVASLIERRRPTALTGQTSPRSSTTG